ncbi:acyl carrier protein [Mycobacteroides chelonae]|nr:acyl carrier protein [Mycobacteroides chelonae]
MNSNTSGLADLGRLNEKNSQRIDSIDFHEHDVQQFEKQTTPAQAEHKPDGIQDRHRSSTRPICPKNSRLPAIYVRVTALEIVRKVLQATQIDTARPLVDYGLDSIRATELVVELEDTFHIGISDEQTTHLITVDDIADHVIAELVRNQRIL